MTETATAPSIAIPATALTLAPGEHYAGVVLDEHGRVLHHLILLPAFAESLDWQAAQTWAEGAGGALPTRQEQALLYANCKPHLQPRWHWSAESEGSSYAWCCGFLYGTQYYYYRSAKGCAVAVRRLNP